MKNLIVVLTLSAWFISFPNLSFASLTRANGTWTYDTIYNSLGQKIGQKPGLFAKQINEFNALAKSNHKITQIFSYGGDLEMYCQGSGESDDNEPCTEKNMQVYYDAGKESTAAYNKALKEAGDEAVIVPIVDGRLDADNKQDDLLRAFNHLDQPTAKLYADKVAKLYCADERVYGVQFDIEPFDINQLGQAYFYEQIAKDFAGLNNPNPDGTDPLHCVSKTHPQGRFFSIFTFAKEVNAKVADILNRYQNGYIIDSLYDLGPNPGGQVNSPEDFRRYVNLEIQDMLAKGRQYNVKFQFAVPAAASAHEFESKAGNKTGYQQIDYIKAAFEAIDNNQARADVNFLGIAIWSWNDRMIWHGDAYLPAQPTDAVKAYLAEKL